MNSERNTRCRCCGSAVAYAGRGRPRIYCASCSPADRSRVAYEPVVRAPRACEHCGETFQPPAKGRLPKYCSERCRRDACVRVGACADCGTELVYRNGDKPGKRCADCSAASHSARFAASEKRAELIRLYRADVPLSEIAERLGYSNPQSVAVALWRLRNRYGIEIDHRYELDENGRRTAHAA